VTRKRLILLLSAVSLAFTLQAQERVPGFTEVQAGVRFASGDLFPAEGTGLLSGIVEGRAAHALDSIRNIEGNVSYERGVKRAVTGNNSSDWLLLAPYVMTDTVGGDLQKEQYRFYARYSARPGRHFLYGVHLSYRALHEYREVDPRPRNVTNDLLLGFSAGWRGSQYALAAQLSYRKYHQISNVAFYNPLGYNTAVFHSYGPGRYNTRFSGGSASMSSRFRGNGAELLVTLEPLCVIGWKAGVSYSVFQVVRHLPTYNETPLTSLLHQRWQLYAGYRWKRSSVEARTGVSLREGTENVIDNSSAFNAILGLPLFHSASYWGRLTGSHAWQGRVIGLRLFPEAGFLWAQAGQTGEWNRTLMLTGAALRARASWTLTPGRKIYLEGHVQMLINEEAKHLVTSNLSLGINF